MIETSHGAIAIRETTADGPDLLMIHGNSSSGAVFRNQLSGALGERFRIIAPDLPGHGKSGNATDPDRTYNMVGYADAMTEVLNILGVKRVAIFGWSLGGHIALEMIDRFPGISGIMITGTPPVSASQLGEGFIPSPHMGLAGKEDFTAEDVENYARSTCGEPFDSLLVDAVARTDGRARRMMFEKFASGVGRDQNQLVAGDTPPIAVLNGADEPFVNTDFVAKVNYRNLWEGKTHLLENSGHAPFWDSPDRFDPILKRFVVDISRI
jgi:pimeloyl-ACP methyl ester carboxylesterase